MKYHTLFIFLSLFFTSNASERILHFHSDISVLEGNTLKIIEVITVKAEAIDIQRGIFRALPTRYKTKYNLNYEVDYKVHNVLKDGKNVAYHIQKLPNELQIYIGSKNTFLEPGIYSYTIEYTCSDVLIAYDEVDVLYWNVNGNYWNFPMDTISVEVHLPKKVSIESLMAYTGHKGEKGVNYAAIQHNSQNASFYSMEPYFPNEALTIEVSFTKGSFKEVSMWKKLFQDNKGIFAGFASLILMLAYFCFVWYKVGIDPPSGTIIPQFEIPKEFSPAQVRYIYKMGFDKKGFTSAIVNLAIKGYLSIKESKKGIFTLSKLDGSNKILSKNEKKLLSKLFGNRVDLKLTQSNHAKINAAQNALKSGLKSEIQSQNFKLNKSYFIIGLLIALPGILYMFFSDPSIFANVTISFFPLFFIVAFLSNIVIRLLNGSRASKVFLLIGAFVIVVFSIFIFNFLNTKVVLFGIVFTMYITALILFNYLLKAPTILGRKNMDLIEGLQMYLKTAEEPRMVNQENVEDSIKLFEKMLPYAIALNCETQWTKRFEANLKKHFEQANYQPTWYSASKPFVVNNFSNQIGSNLQSAITQSSVAPSSSTGGEGSFSSGGGFSGGGFGGGGGGGW